jgi:hypothetical protein
MPGPHLARRLDIGSPQPGGCLIGLDWTTGLVLTAGGLFR